MAQISLQLNDGLDLSLPIAGPGARAYAFLLDFKFRTAAALLWIGLSGWILSMLRDKEIDKVFQEDGTANLLILWIPSLIIYFLYHPIFEYLMSGRTPGKRLAGIRITDRLGRAPSLQQIIIRNVLRLTDGLPAFYALGLGVCFLSRERLRIGDMAAGTVLVHEGLGLKQLRKTMAARAASDLPAGDWEFAHALHARWHYVLPSERLRLANAYFAKRDPAHRALMNARVAYQRLAEIAGAKPQPAAGP
jgi:uncharacterized RDD family membrane protein YckC